MDKVWNEEMRKTAVVQRKLVSRAVQRVLSWFGHVWRMD